MRSERRPSDAQHRLRVKCAPWGPKSLKLGVRGRLLAKQLNLVFRLLSTSQQKKTNEQTKKTETLSLPFPSQGLDSPKSGNS